MAEVRASGRVPRGRRARERRSAVQADLVGRETGRLGDRLGRQVVGPDLRRAAGVLLRAARVARPARRLVGVLLGLVGVARPRRRPSAGRVHGTVGIAAVVLASVSYAAANLYAGRRMGVGGPVLAAVSMTGRSCCCSRSRSRRCPRTCRGGSRRRPVSRSACRDGARADPVVPDDPAVRLVALVARRVHAPGVRARVRRALPDEGLTVEKLAGLVLIGAASRSQRRRSASVTPCWSSPGAPTALTPISCSS